MSPGQIQVEKENVPPSRIDQGHLNQRRVASNTALPSLETIAADIG